MTAIEQAEEAMRELAEKYAPRYSDSWWAKEMRLRVEAHEIQVKADEAFSRNDKQRFQELHEEWKEVTKKHKKLWG